MTWQWIFMRRVGIEVVTDGGVEHSAEEGADDTAAVAMICWGHGCVSVS